MKLKLKEEHRLRVLDSRVLITTFGPKRDNRMKETTA
jgi:hypothetical protein